MTDEELIARLLDWEEYDEGDINDAREAAANRIKELKAELAGGSFYQEKDIDALQNRISAQAAEIERLQAKLAKAVGVIDWALIAWDDHNKHGYNMQGDWVSDARTTLAALTGDNP